MSVGILPRVARALPPRWVSRINRLQFVMPWTAPLLRMASRSLRNGESVIRHGVGRGLKFDPQGGNAGYALGTSETDEQEFLAAHLRPGDVFYDIGANVGFFAVLGAKLVGPAGHVYAFEPFPRSAAAIRHNAAINQFNHVAVMESAVSERSGKGSFIIEGTSVQFHLAGAGFRSTAPHAATVPVDVVSIDELVASNQLRPPQLVMIDVEGSEVEVLRGMAHTIQRHRPILLCEVHWLVGEFRDICHELLEPAGYLVQRLDEQPMSDEPERYHAVALPR